MQFTSQILRRVYDGFKAGLRLEFHRCMSMSTQTRGRSVTDTVYFLIIQFVEIAVTGKYW